MTRWYDVDLDLMYRAEPNSSLCFRASSLSSHFFCDTDKDIIIRLSHWLIDVHWFITITRLNAHPRNTHTNNTPTSSTLPTIKMQISAFYFRNSKNSKLFIIVVTKKHFLP